MCEKIQELAVAFHVLGEKDTEIKALRAKLAESQALCERMQKGLDAVNALMNESGGVYGLHLNGDGASWDSLRTGGRFEEWLVEFDDALTTPKENNHES
jgi:glutaredoxin 2